MIFPLAIKSLRNRRFTAGLTVLSIALSVALLLGVERIRQESRETFASSVSGTDLIVGARSSPVHLLLSSVFRIGNATNNVSWESYRRVAALPEVAWTIPLSLGDSHRGFHVLGTTQDYFDHYRFGRDRKLELAQGERFADADGAVLGAEVAAALGYRLGQQIVIAHGSGDVAFALHKDHPFHVVGILGRTGTPVDRAIHVSLEGMDAVHMSESAEAGGDPLAAAMRNARQRQMQSAGRDDHDRDHDQDRHGAGANETPKRTITAFLVGLKSRGGALFLQRQVNESREEPLTAILPGATLLEVWDIVAGAEKTLIAISALVVVMGLAGMLIALLTGLSERRREMAVLRAVGARPWHVFALLLGEAAFLTLLGIALGIAALYVGLGTGQAWLEQRLGLFIALRWPSVTEFGLMMLVAVSGVLIGLIPAYRIYRLSLADGMTIRI
ncbi:MAG TPA: ABC transporter permease [Casimicrobiaceae bacterium]|jgi:putative ABC transport system permease protein|nr:ABC transporter permease [Casimicrobiaceae bacterium]